MARAPRSRATPAHSGSGRVRIIGGRLRGRKIDIIESPGFRPTPDRVRETLFNWLAPYVPEAVCIDLFAGSGALCLEALSRGAAHVIMVEQDARVAANLKANVAKLTDKNMESGVAEVAHDNALQFLNGPVAPADIIFVDPPFAAPELIGQCIGLIHERGWIKVGGLIYIEAESTCQLPPLPEGWAVHRAKKAGQVAYTLIQASRFDIS